MYGTVLHWEYCNECPGLGRTALCTSFSCYLGPNLHHSYQRLRTR
jgi:hypothetical protein